MWKKLRAYITSPEFLFFLAMSAFLLGTLYDSVTLALANHDTRITALEASDSANGKKLSVIEYKVNDLRCALLKRGCAQ